MNLHALFKGTRTSILRVYQFHHLGELDKIIIANCALRETRTPTPLLALAPEASLSTDSSIRAGYFASQKDKIFQLVKDRKEKFFLRERRTIVAKGSKLDNDSN